MKQGGAIEPNIKPGLPFAAASLERWVLGGAVLALVSGLPLIVLEIIAGRDWRHLIIGVLLSAILGGGGGALLVYASRNRQGLTGLDPGLSDKAEQVAQLGSAVRDLRTGISIWSKEFHAILGLEPGDVTPSQDILLESVHPSDRDRVDNALHAVLEGNGQRDEIFRIIKPNGEIRVIHGHAELSLDRQGLPLRLDAVIQDVTDRKRLENELDALIRELWRSNEELEQFAYVASHDLRQPLRVVSSYVSLLEEELQGNLPGDSMEFMAYVKDGVRRMDRLINDLLTYSRVGRVASDQRISMATALKAALDDLQFDLEDAGATVTVPGSLPEVMGDQSELERLFQNLVGNAIKYRHPDKAPRIEVVCDEEETCWRVRVSDNGIGIPPEHTERVFGIFQRLHARDEYEGTGVGLAIVKKIVERHGGTIWVEESPLGGATLVFTWAKALVNPE